MAEIARGDHFAPDDTEIINLRVRLEWSHQQQSGGQSFFIGFMGEKKVTGVMVAVVRRTQTNRIKLVVEPLVVLSESALSRIMV